MSGETAEAQQQPLIACDSADQPAVMPCTAGVADGCGFCFDSLDDSKGLHLQTLPTGNAEGMSGGGGETTQRIHVEMTSRKWHGIKQSLELIRNSYRSCIITADKNLFQIMAYDTKGQSLGFLLKIPTANIEPYVCLSPISISVFTSRIAEIIRQVRKNETVMFYIDSRNQVCGILSNSTTGHARKRETSVSIVQLTYFEEPPVVNMSKPFVVATSDFGRMLKEMRNVADTVVVTARPSEWIRFNVSSPHSTKNDEWFGKINPLPPTLRHEYPVQQFVKVIKISSLNTTDLEISFACQDDTAVLAIQVDLPKLGQLSVYFTSHDQQAPPATEITPQTEGKPDSFQPRAKKPRA